MLYNDADAAYRPRMKNNDYRDIINLPHHVSYSRRHMSVHDRAAQFAPFAALTGLEDSIEDSAKSYAERFNAYYHNTADIPGA